MQKEILVEITRLWGLVGFDIEGRMVERLVKPDWIRRLEF
jgi:hypothetical protein